MSEHHVLAWCLWKLDEVTDPLEMELHMSVRHHSGATN